MPTSPIAPRRRLWPVFVMPALVLIAAAAWSRFWFYAASHVDEKFDEWRTREAKSGRAYECASRSVAGFPFRMEVRCGDPVVTLTSQTADRTQLTARLKDILVVAQVYDPTKIIAEFTGPATVSAGAEAPSFVAGWATGRASASGLPTPQRVSLVFDDPAVDRMSGSTQSPLLRAKHLELHTRLLEGSLSNNPVVETALLVNAGSLQGLHPILAEPFDADIRALLRGLKDFSPKPWPERFREIQAAGGRLDFTQSRVQQGESIAVAAVRNGIRSASASRRMCRHASESASAPTPARRSASSRASTSAPARMYHGRVCSVHTMEIQFPRQVAMCCAHPPPCACFILQISGLYYSLDALLPLTTDWPYGLYDLPLSMGQVSKDHHVL